MIKVGFVLTMDASWQGGLNYFKNLFNSIYRLPNRELDLVVFLGAKNINLIVDDLPPVQIVVSSAFDRHSLLWWVRKLFQRLFQKDPILWFLIRKYKINVLSHFNESVVFESIPVISWIPDFQHVNLPGFFTLNEISARNKLFLFLAKNSNAMILSSYAAKGDFINFSPIHSTKARVLQFCINPDLKLKQGASLLDLKRRYQFQGEYFFLPNQFWVHKNHQVVIEALSLAVRVNKNIQIICTGNTNDYWQPEYLMGIQKLIKSLKLEENFRILGLVPYQDLISLMRGSIAVINPSRFEGWSTTVEESKLLDKKVLLSNIDVHLEQKPEQALYFDVNDSQRLANYLVEITAKVSANPFELYESSSNYDKLFVEFGNEYQKIVLASISRE